MNKPLKYKFPTVLLCFTLVLAILLTGFTEPGFLLPLIGEKQESGKTGIGGVTVSSDGSSGGTGREGVPKEVKLGDSKAFTKTPYKGITVSAEENALEKDYDVTLTEASDNEIASLSETLSEITDSGEYVVAAYEFDAGMTDEEIAPGKIHMSFDLAELGLDEESYLYTSIYRVDDSGIWYEYATTLEGSVMSLDTDQNCAIVIGGIIAIPALIFGFDFWAAYTQDGYVFSCVQNKSPVFYESNGKTKKIMQLYYNDSILQKDADSSRTRLEAEINAKVTEINEKAIARADAELGNVAAHMNDPAFRERRVELIKEYARLIANEDAEIAAIKAKFKPVTDPAEGQGLIGKAADYCRKAYQFLDDNITIYTPKYVCRIELSDEMTQSGTAISPFVGHPYCIVNVKQELGALLCSITHEYYHMCQRTLVLQMRQNVKFDEAMACAVEALAFDYYYDKGYLEFSDGYGSQYLTQCGGDLKMAMRHQEVEALYQYKYYAMGLDNTDTTVTYPEGKYTDTAVSAAADYYYTYGDFILYLKSKYKSVTFDDMLRIYKSYWIKSDFKGILKDSFGLDEKGFDREFRNFVADREEGFYNSFYAESREGNVISEELVLAGNKADVTLENKDYTVRMRTICVKKLRDSDTQFGVALVMKNDFKTNMPDMEFIQHKFDDGRTVYTAGNKFVLSPVDFLGVGRQGKITGMEFFEVDGGTGDAGSKSGYTAYPLYAPDTPTVDSRDKKLTITFPDPEKSPSYEIAEGYLVRLYSGNTLEEAFAVDFDDLDEKNSFTINLEDLYTDDLKSLWMTASEYLGDSDEGDELYGPETERISLAGGYSGKWVLTDSQSYSEDGLNNSQHVEKRTASGNTFYHYEEERLLSNDGSTYEYRNINESTATFTNLPSSLNPGELFTVISKINVTQSSYDYNGDDVDILIYYDVSSSEISKIAKDEDTSAKRSRPDRNEKSDTETEWLIDLPAPEGNSVKVAIVYEYDYHCRTTYTYTWQPTGTTVGGAQ